MAVRSAVAHVSSVACCLNTNVCRLERIWKNWSSAATTLSRVKARCSIFPKPRLEHGVMHGIVVVCRASPSHRRKKRPLLEWMLPYIEKPALSGFFIGSYLLFVSDGKNSGLSGSGAV